MLQSFAYDSLFPCLFLFLLQVESQLTGQSQVNIPHEEYFERIEEVLNREHSRVIPLAGAIVAKKRASKKTPKRKAGSARVRNAKRRSSGGSDSEEMESEEDSLSDASLDEMDEEEEEEEGEEEEV